MTELIVSLEDASLLTDVKNATTMLRGVSSVKVKKSSSVVNAVTREAIAAADRGETINCKNFEEYLNLVNNGI